MTARGYFIAASWTDEGEGSLSFERDTVVYSVYEADQPKFFEIVKFTYIDSEPIGACSLPGIKHLLP